MTCWYFFFFMIARSRTTTKYLILLYVINPVAKIWDMHDFKWVQLMFLVTYRVFFRFILYIYECFKIIQEALGTQKYAKNKNIMQFLMLFNPCVFLVLDKYVVFRSLNSHFIIVRTPNRLCAVSRLAASCN